MKALCFEKFGGPEVLEYRDLPEPTLAPGTALGDLWNVPTSREERSARAAELFECVRRGKLKVRISEKFLLREGVKADA